MTASGDSFVRTFAAVLMGSGLALSVLAPRAWPSPRIEIGGDPARVTRVPEAMDPRDRAFQAIAEISRRLGPPEEVPVAAPDSGGGLRVNGQLLYYGGGPISGLPGFVEVIKHYKWRGTEALIFHLPFLDQYAVFMQGWEILGWGRFEGRIDFGDSVTLDGVADFQMGFMVSAAGHIDLADLFKNDDFQMSAAIRPVIRAQGLIPGFNQGSIAAEGGFRFRIGAGRATEGPIEIRISAGPEIQYNIDYSRAQFGASGHAYLFFIF